MSVLLLYSAHEHQRPFHCDSSIRSVTRTYKGGVTNSIIFFALVVSYLSFSQRILCVDSGSSSNWKAAKHDSCNITQPICKVLPLNGLKLCWKNHQKKLTRLIYFWKREKEKGKSSKQPKQKQRKNMNMISISIENDPAGHAKKARQKKFTGPREGERKERKRQLSKEKRKGKKWGAAKNSKLDYEAAASKHLISTNTPNPNSCSICKVLCDRFKFLSLTRRRAFLWWKLENAKRGISFLIRSSLKWLRGSISSRLPASLVHFLKRPTHITSSSI